MRLNNSWSRIGGHLHPLSLQNNDFNKHLESPTEAPDELNPVDSGWILICAFLIFTMQTGFGLLEAGIVSRKNETNIILKNVADVILGGLSYWIFGYGITYGSWRGSSPVFGIGDYAVDASAIGPMGDLFTSFFFQLSFATTATTIVSGAMAERCNFKAYCIYSFFATITYSVQARWVWGPTGFLKDLGVIDIAGSGAVHLMGGTAAFVGAWMLGPRIGRYDDDETVAPAPGNPFNVLLGLFNLWWGWFAFNAGSTYGLTGAKWKFAARAASTTIIASIGGGCVGIAWGFLKRWGKPPFEILDVVNAILGALVGITAGCAVFHTPEAFLTGIIGAIVALASCHIPDKLKVDDPVGATAVHGFAGIWGMLSIGFFADEDGGILDVTKGNYGVVRGGSAYLLGVQLLAVCCIIAWSAVTTFIILWLINLIIPLRVLEHEERLGLDFCEHGIRQRGSLAISSMFSPNNSEVCQILKNAMTAQNGGGTHNDHRKNDGRTPACSAGSRRSPRDQRSLPMIGKPIEKKRQMKWITALVYKAIKGMQGKRHRKNDVLPWKPENTLVEYSTPIPSAITLPTTNVHNEHDEQQITKDKMMEGGGGGHGHEHQTTATGIIEWTRHETQQELLIVKKIKTSPSPSPPPPRFTFASAMEAYYGS